MADSSDEGKVSFGHTPLPDEQREALRKARRLEWASIGTLVVTVGLVMAVMGSSQAMKAAWIEDCLSFLPPIAFLISARLVGRTPDGRHPYGWHRAVGAGHLASALALLTMGGFLVFESTMTLVRREHPTIGTMKIADQAFWAGWAMIAVMVVTSVPPVVLGRMKEKLAQTLHDKVLFADADMNKADWQTALGAVLGILGIGIGWWWADSAVALFIGGSILLDGVKNLRNAVRGLLDATARTFDDKQVHPAVRELEQAVRGLGWVRDVRVRVRDLGHLLHAEVFVVPFDGYTLADLAAARELGRQVDWKLRDLVVVPVAQLPDEIPPTPVGD